MLEWLKEIVSDKKKPAKGKVAPATPSCHVKVDSRTYPLLNLNAKAFAAGEADANLIKDQNLTVTVVVDDRFGKFSFGARCTVVGIDANHRFTGAFALLPPEVEQVLSKYARNKSSAGPGK